MSTKIGSNSHQAANVSKYENQVCKEPAPKTPTNTPTNTPPKKPAVQHQKSTFEKLGSKKEKAKNTISAPSKKSSNISVTSSSSYFQATGKLFNGKDGKNGVHAELTAGQAKGKVGTKKTELKGEVKVLTAEAKSIINTKKRSAEGSLGATAIEGGLKVRYGNYGAGMKVGAGFGLTGRLSLCDDANKDGQKEISLSLMGGFLGKYGASLRLPNYLQKYVCPK